MSITVSFATCEYDCSRFREIPESTVAVETIRDVQKFGHDPVLLAEIIEMLFFTSRNEESNDRNLRRVLDKL